MRSIFIAFLAIFSFTHASAADIEDNDVWQDAKPLAQDTSVAGTQADEDWYVINAVVGNRILIDLTFTHAEGNMDLALYNDAGSNDPFPGQIRGASVTTDSDHEFIDANVPPGPATYYIRVFAGTGGDQGNGYALTWTEMGAEDDFEDNDGIANSAPITEATVAFGSQSNADEDWYSITAAEDGTRLLVSLRFELAADLDLALHDDGGTLLAESRSAAGINESIDYTALTKGTYHLNVSGNSSGAGIGYALDWQGIVPATTPPATTPPATTPAPASGGSSGSVSLIWLFALMLAGLARKVRS